MCTLYTVRGHMTKKMNKYVYSFQAYFHLCNEWMRCNFFANNLEIERIRLQMYIHIQIAAWERRSCFLVQCEREPVITVRCHGRTDEKILGEILLKQIQYINFYVLVIVRIIVNIRSTVCKRNTTRGFKMIQLPGLLNNKFMEGSFGRYRAIAPKWTTITSEREELV